MMELNNAVLEEFACRGLRINEGIAVDVRLIKSASKPLSKKKAIEGAQGREGEKSNNTQKFSRDLDSDWTVKNGEPPYGLKEHASIDVNNGFILAVTLTAASVHDSKYLPYLAMASFHTRDNIKILYADKGFYWKPNGTFLYITGIKDGIVRENTTASKITEWEVERNKKISKKRYVIKQYFGLCVLHYGAYRARFTELIKNLWDTICRQMAFNIFRGTKLLT